MEHGPRERPDPTDEGIEQAVGKVLSIGIEQEGGRDAVTFVLQRYLSHEGLYGPGGELIFVETDPLTLNYFLDVGVTVGLAQLQLLRDALLNDWWVRVHYSTDDGYPREGSPPYSWVYFVQVAKNGVDA